MTLWIALALGAQDPALERKVAELVEKLSSEAIDAREEAAAALVALGPAAAPLLEARERDADAELGGRLREAVKAIARDAVLGKRWRPARRMDLEWRDAPLSTVLRELATASGERFEGVEGLSGQVTLALRGATLWEALEAVARSTPVTWAVDGEALRFTGRKRPSYPSLAKDEMLAWLDVLEYGQDVDFGAAPREWVTVGVNLAWTSGISPLRVDLRVLEALDETGASIPSNVVGRGPAERPVVGAARQRREELRLLLRGGARIDRLRGRGALLFPRGFEDLRLEFGSGAPLKSGDATLVLRGGTATRDVCAFQLVLSVNGSEPRLPPEEVVVIDDLGAERPATGRGVSTSAWDGGWSMSRSYEAPLGDGRKAAAVRVRRVKEVLERVIEFDFGGLPKP